jgi:hypothetical protein
LEKAFFIALDCGIKGFFGSVAKGDANGKKSESD